MVAINGNLVEKEFHAQDLIKTHENFNVTLLKGRKRVQYMASYTVTDDRWLFFNCWSNVQSSFTVYNWFNFLKTENKNKNTIITVK